jgi:tetratricopeptide (TPR) repeat protein
VLLLLPFFALGITMGLITAYLERNHVGAVGPQWDYSPTVMGEIATRTLIAGRAIWFYFGKLVWPWPLAFMYERWVVDVSDLRQWVYPIGAALVILLLALSRKRPAGRGALCAALLFVGTLFPALGYFNVYPHRYSFVADHFQHLASIAVTSAICAGLVLLANRLQISAKPQATVGAGIVVVLGCLTFLQSRIYESPVTLWTDTTQKSPSNWIAFTALGRALADAEQMEPAMTAHQRAYELNPNVADTNYNLAMVQARRNETDAAEKLLRRAIELSAPKDALHQDAMIKLGYLYEDQRKDPTTAEVWFKRAADSGYPPAKQAHADFLRRRGRH